MYRKLAVVCTGNICRSPIAEELFRRRLGHQGLVCLSAGTYALAGHGADSKACEVMAERGFDISGHRAQQATSDLLRSADLILALDQTHIDWITRNMPHLRGRVFKLGKWDGNSDVEDPYRKPKAVFEETYDVINHHVNRWASMLVDTVTVQTAKG